MPFPRIFSVPCAITMVWAPSMLVMRSVAGCAGKDEDLQARRKMLPIIHPQAVHPVTLGGHVVQDRTVIAVLGFMPVFGGVIIGLTMALPMTAVPCDAVCTAVVVSFDPMGPGLGEVGPAGSCAGLTDFQVWVCTLNMIPGRLEVLSFLVLSFLVLFTPGCWRK